MTDLQQRAQAIVDEAFAAARARGEQPREAAVRGALFSLGWKLDASKRWPLWLPPGGGRGVWGGAGDKLARGLRRAGQLEAAELVEAVLELVPA